MRAGLESADRAQSIRLSVYAMVRIAMGCLMAIGTPVLCATYGHQERERFRLLIETGQHTNAQITQLKRSGDESSIEYTFTPPSGLAVHGTWRGPTNDVPNAPVGETIDIVYAPMHPETNWISPLPSAEQIATRGSEIIWAIVLAPLLFGSLVVLDGWRVRRQVQLVRKCRVVAGNVVGKYRAGVTTEGVQYVFQTQEGTEVKGRSPVSFSALRQFQSAGSCVVLYDPADPARNSVPQSLWAIRAKDLRGILSQAS